MIPTSAPNTQNAVGGTAAHDAKRLSVGVSGLYLGLYIHYGFFAFLPLWLKATGAGPEEIGILMAIPLILRLLTVAPFSAWVGRLGRVRDAIAFTALGSAVVILTLLGQPEHAGRIAIVVLFSIIWDQLPVLTDAYAVMAVRSRGLDFGRLRVFGSIAVVISNAAAGWAIGVAGIKALPIMIAALLLIPAAIVLGLPRDRKLVAQEEAKGGRWRDVLRDRKLLRAMMAASLVVGSHGVLTSFGAIQWTERGISTGAIGLLQALAVSAEILAFWFGAKLLGKRDPSLLICLAGLAAILRWALMAADPGMAVLIFSQILNGISATGAILGIMLVIAARVSGDLSAAAQGVNAVLFGAVLAVSTAGSGMLWSYGLAPAYLAMAALAALGAVFALPSRDRATAHRANRLSATGTDL